MGRRYRLLSILLLAVALIGVLVIAWAVFSSSNGGCVAGSDTVVCTDNSALKWQVGMIGATLVALAGLSYWLGVRSESQLLAVLILVLFVATACSAKSGAVGVRAKLNGYPDLGWTDSHLDRVGAKVCAEFPDGVLTDPRIKPGSAPGYAAYVGEPEPKWIIKMAPWIWQTFYDAYCPQS